MVTAQRATAAVPASRAAGRVMPEWVATAALLLPTYAWLTLAVFLPLCAMLLFSVLTKAPFGNAQPELTTANYMVFVRQPYLLDVAWTSLKLGFLTTALCALIGLPAALALKHGASGRLRSVLFLLIILPFWTNGLVRIFSWTMVLREGGFLDMALHLVAPDAPSIGILFSRPAILIGLVHGYLPYMILTCFISLLAIDDNLIEAARSLGARSPVIFARVILPLVVPGLVSGAILIFVPVIGSFMEPRILGGRVGVTMGTVIEDQFTAAFNWPRGAALSFTMLAVVLAIFATFSGVLRQSVARADASS
jgi:spermidine/putrescine transport system permease protein